ncbi:MAG: hypothetical protein ACW981_08265 [Candidatus Hodarchaeales archaeon]|jgi:hypothetical protein
MPEIIVTILDSLTGPATVYSVSNQGSIEEHLITKVSVRSNLSLSLMEEDSTLENADAVLPFSEMGRTGYCYYFYVPSKSEKGKNICAIIYLLPSSQNFELYKNIPLLKPRLSVIGKQIINEYIFETKRELPKSIQNSLKNIVTGKQLVEVSMEPSITQIHANIQRLTEELTGNWDYLIRKVNKNLESVIFDIIIERPVFIASNSSVLIKFAMASLEYFTSRRKLNKGFIEEYIDDIETAELDLIGINRDLALKIKHYTLIDLDKEKIINYTNRTHFKDFLKSLKGLKTLGEFEQQINYFLDQIFSKATELVDIFSVSPLDDNRLKDFQKNLEKDELEAIVEITAKRNPLISSLLKENMGKKVSDWLNDF